jgi:hypothetical protein
VHDESQITVKCVIVKPTEEPPPSSSPEMMCLALRHALRSADELQCEGGTQPMDLSHINAEHTVQHCPDIEGGCVVVALPRTRQQNLRRQGAIYTHAEIFQPGSRTTAVGSHNRGRSDTALGTFYRRLSSRAGKSKAVTASARKIAVLFAPAWHELQESQVPTMSNNIAAASSLTFSAGPNRWALSFRPFPATPIIRLFPRKTAAQCRRDWLGEYLVGARLERDRLIARVDTTRALLL